MDDKLLKSLLKKAIGYNVSEVSEEYTVDNEGVEQLSKRKVTKKYIPPDLTALKTYLELTESENDYENLTDEELLKIKNDLIKELKIEGTKNKVRK